MGALNEWPGAGDKPAPTQAELDAIDAARYRGLRQVALCRGTLGWLVSECQLDHVQGHATFDATVDQALAERPFRATP